MGVMKTALFAILLTSTCGLLSAQVGHDLKEAGVATKDAATTATEKTKAGTKKAYHKTKHVVKKGVHKSADATARGADKVSEKTSTNK